MENNQIFKNILADHLNMGEAFLPIDKIINSIPFKLVGIRPAGLPHSIFELLYHIQYAQKDILTYCQEEGYRAPSWPDQYWPNTSSPRRMGDWEDLKTTYIKTRIELQELVRSSDLLLEDKVKGQDNESGEVHSIFREILLVLEHSAYHTGQLVLIARLLKQYP